MVRCMTLYLVAQSCVLMGSDGTDLGMAAPGMGIEPAVMSIGPVDMGTSVLPSACLASAWHRENPLPTGHSLVGVWGVDASNVWVVGLCGALRNPEEKERIPSRKRNKKRNGN